MQTEFRKLNPNTPAGFLAALGILRLIHPHDPDVKLSWAVSELTHPIFHSKILNEALIRECIYNIVPTKEQCDKYRKLAKTEKEIRSKFKTTEKLTAKESASNLLVNSEWESILESFCSPPWQKLGNSMAVNVVLYRKLVSKAKLNNDSATLEYLAAICSDGELEKGNTTKSPWQIVRGGIKVPSALTYIREIYDTVTKESIERVLDGMWTYENTADVSLRWHPAIASHALHESKPNTLVDGCTEVGLNRLAIDGLPFFPCFKKTAPSWKYEENIESFIWALWKEPLDIQQIQSLINILGKVHTDTFKLERLGVSHLYSADISHTTHYQDIKPSRLNYMNI